MLYDLAGQVVKHLKSYLSNENDVLNVLQYHQQQLAALATSCQALEDSQLWRMTRMLHRAWCRLSGNPGHRTPLEHMQMILRDHKPRGG